MKDQDEEYYDSYEDQWVNEYNGHWLNLPNGIQINPVKLGDEKGTTFDRECEHETVEVGFQFTKVVCKKCDKELPKEALYGKKTFQ